jgi:hypothetical protein
MRKWPSGDDTWDTRQVWVLVLAGLLLFIPFEMLPITWQTDFELVDGIGSALTLGIVVSCASSAWRTLKPPFHEVTCGQVFVTFIFILMLGLTLLLGGLWLWRILDQPRWLAESHFWMSNRWMIIFACAVILTINWRAEGIVAAGAYTKTALFVAIGAALAVVTVTIGARFLQ